MPITHASYSSINLFLKNQSAWHSKYVLGIRDVKTSPAALVGVAFHRYAELLLSGADKPTCIEIAERVIRETTDVDWGKTGSVEKSLCTLHNLVQFFNEEMEGELPFLNDAHILGLEKCIQCKARGIKLPLKSFVDLIFEDNNGALCLLDWKTKRAYSDKLSPAYKLQATVYYLQTKTIYKKAPARMIFSEIKTSKNKDGTPQIKNIIYDYTDPSVQQEMKAIVHLIKNVIKKMTAKRQDFLPNISDEYEGEKEFARYVNNFNEPLC